MHKKFIFLLSASIAYGAAPAVTCIKTTGSAALYKIDTNAVLHLFYEEVELHLDCVKQAVDIAEREQKNIIDIMLQQFEALASKTCSLEDAEKRLYRICRAIEMRVNNGYNRSIKQNFRKKRPKNGQYFTSTRHRFT